MWDKSTNKEHLDQESTCSADSIEAKAFELP